MKIVYDTAIAEIEMLSKLTEADIRKNPNILKISQLKNSHILTILKQQEIDYKMQDLMLRETMYNIRVDRNDIMRENNEIKKNKLDR